MTRTTFEMLREKLREQEDLKRDDRKVVIGKDTKMCMDNLKKSHI